MCGISGILSLNGRSITEDGLRKFNCSLAHRGPDGEGYYFDQDHLLGLAHRRLKILDMSDSGKQPMSFANDRFHITYNGEVYNFIELRRELEDLGYKFISQSDTEVVLASFHKWGIDCLKRFNGMWAFAIWDSEKRELFLARDRFGIKPLYYLHIPNCIFAFASETIAFDFLDQHVREINGSNLSLALVDSFALEGKGQTIYKNVFQVLPGHYILLKGNQDGVVQKRWWSTIENTYQVNKKYQEQCEEFYSLFESACKIRLRSDVPIGTALSGGVDSSAVYCTIQHLMKNAISRERIPENWQQAFVGIFPDTKFDERKFAEEVLNYSKGHAAFIQSDHSNLVSKLIASTRLFDSIYFSPIIAGAEIYSAMNSAGIRVSLDGHGADELLYGYPHLITSILSYARENNLKDLRKDAENTYLGLFPESEKEILMDQMKASSNRKNRFSVKHLYYRHVS
ncbi:MAG TPA: asparagine synthase (glutamine-hydrolyzing) [Bacteroidia bacterium]